MRTRAPDAPLSRFTALHTNERGGRLRAARSPGNAPTFRVPQRCATPSPQRPGGTVSRSGTTPRALRNRQPGTAGSRIAANVGLGVAAATDSSGASHAGWIAAVRSRNWSRLRPGLAKQRECRRRQDAFGFSFGSGITVAVRRRSRRNSAIAMCSDQGGTDQPPRGGMVAFMHGEFRKRHRTDILASRAGNRAPTVRIPNRTRERDNAQTTTDPEHDRRLRA